MNESSSRKRHLSQTESSDRVVCVGEPSGFCMTEHDRFSSPTPSGIFAVARLGLLAAGLLLAGRPAFAVNLAPLITTNPLSQTVATGAIAFVSVVATGNSLQYAWTLNGDVLTTETNSTLAITNISTATSGAYQVTVYNDGGSVRSTKAIVVLSANPLPFADNFANRGTITTVLGSGSGDSTAATTEAGEPKPVSARVGKSVWLTWVAPTNGMAFFRTIGSAFDTVVAVYTGTSLSNLVEVTRDDDNGSHHDGEVGFNAVAGTAYHISVGSLDADGGKIQLLWFMLFSSYALPTSVVPPASITTMPGRSASLSVRFLSATPVMLQWYRNGWPIPGATNSLLQLPQLTENDLGIYQVCLMAPSFEWIWFVGPAEIQFNSQGTSTAIARNKLIQVLSQ